MNWYLTPRTPKHARSSLFPPKKLQNSKPVGAVLPLPDVGPRQVASPCRAFLRHSRPKILPMCAHRCAFLVHGHVYVQLCSSPYPPRSDPDTYGLPETWGSQQAAQQHASYKALAFAQCTDRADEEKEITCVHVRRCNTYSNKCNGVWEHGKELKLNYLQVQMLDCFQAHCWSLPTNSSMEFMASGAR